MATATNNTTITAPNGGRFTLTSYFNEESTSTTNNTSSIKVRATLYSNTAAFAVSNAGVLSIYWHDNNTNEDVLKSSITVTECGDANPYYYGSKSVETTFNVSHKADGTLSGYAIAKWEKSNYGSYNHFIPASGTVATANTALTTIPRAATLSFDVSSITVGDTFWASNDPYVSGFTYTLVASNNNGSYTFYTKQNVTMTLINSGVSASNFYRFLSSTQKYADVTFTLTTYSGNTSIGTNTKTLRVNANANDLPTVTISSVDTGKQIVGNNRTTLDLTGSNKRIINQWNSISTTWSATTGFNTNITNVSINGTTVSTSPTTFNNLSNTISITATNGRGYSKTITENDLTFIPYELPSIVPTLKRNTATDGHANLTFTGMFYNTNFGAESNTLTLEWYVREKGDTTYTQGATPLTYTINSNNQSYVSSATISLVNPLDQVDGLFDYQKAYEFKFVATDKITSYTISEVILTKGIPNFVVFKDAILANDKRVDNIYSTSEVKIGTWIDGKPIYRKVMSFTPISQTTNLGGIANIDTLIYAGGTSTRNNSGHYKNLIPCNYSGWEIYLYDITTNYGVLKYSNNQWNEGVTNALIVFEYTKTTD